MTKTKIEWADRVWNPVTGCSKVSEGCRNCYAERIAKRFWGERKFTDVQCHEDRLDAPLHWRKPARVFVNSMSDLFHPDVPFKFIDRVFVKMNVARRHTFIILTKRHERMLNYLRRYTPGGWHTHEIIRHETDLKFPSEDKFVWPLPNVWLGVSIEDQATADERIPLLLQTPAAKRVVSYEPALGPVDFDCWPETGCSRNWLDDDGGFDWLIMGGESGPGARPMHPDWACSVRDQCQAAGVPFFFKQWGEWIHHSQMEREMLTKVVGANKYYGEREGKLQYYRVGKKAAGRLLDGKEWNEVPE